MDRYLNLGGDSQVTGYELGPSSVRVRFKDGSIYRYTVASAGAQNIQQMKHLAVQGHGLNAFINTTVRKMYEAKEQ